jgi:hypothetical protein
MRVEQGDAQMARAMGELCSGCFEELARALPQEVYQQILMATDVAARASTCPTSAG